MRRYIACFVIMCMLMVSGGTSLALANAPTAVTDKILAVELELYGMEQAGALMERTARVEFDLYNEAYAKPIIERVEGLYTAVIGDGSGSPTFISKLNAVEVTFNKTITDKPAKTRLEDMEKTISGTVHTEGGMMARLNALAAMTFPGGEVAMERVTLPKDTLIKISIQKELAGRVNKAGEDVPFRAEDNIYVGEALVIPKGAMGTAKIKKIADPALFGKDGRIDLEFKHLPGMDGTKVPIEMGDVAKKMTQSQIQAGGAALAGMVLLGPLGAAGGLFVKGKVAKVPLGTTVYVQVKDDTVLSGVRGMSGK